MRARKLLDRSGAPIFSPETMKVVYQAFDSAWAMISSNYSSDPAIDAARLKLAEAVLAVMRDDSRDPEQVKNLALQLMRVSS